MERRTRTLLGLSGGCVVLFGLLLAAAYAWGPGRSLDNLGLSGFVSINVGWVREAAWRLIDLGDPMQVTLITGLLAALAVARGRPRVALVVILLIGLTSVSSQVLKELLAHVRFSAGLDRVVGPDAFPSGHATAAMSLALAGVFAAPRSARLPAALLGSLLALGVGASAVTIGWHFPSDVLGGYLLATCWAFLLAAVLQEADRRFPARERWASTAFARASDRIAAGGLSAAAVAGAAVAVVAALGALAGAPGGVADYTREHTSFVAVAVAVASAALALPVAMAALLRRG
jgi:membrane-associated phospholipid phosphatase